MKKTSTAAIGLSVLIMLSLLFGLNSLSAIAEQQLSDDFNSASLDNKWVLIDPDGGSSISLTANPGWLRISTASPPGRDLIGSVTNAPRLMQSQISGEFSIETKVSATMTKNDEGAGILVWKDSNQYIRFERMSRTIGNPVEQQIFFAISGGSFTKVTLAENINPTYLKLVKSGNNFSGYYSSDDNTWIKVATFPFAIADTVTVGLDLINVYHDDSFFADFDYFKIASPSSSNLVGYWKLDEGNGANINDFSGYANNGVLFGNPTWIEGASGTAMVSDGIDDFAQIPDSSSLRVQNFTLSAWINLPVRPYLGGHSNHTHYCIINKMHYQGTTLKAGYKLDFEYPTAIDDTLVLTIGDGVDQRFLVQYNSINDLTTNQWHHVAGTYNGTVACIYIDGQLKAINPCSYVILHDSTPLCFSREISQPDYDGLKGVIDEVRIYDRSLTDLEIQNLYSSIQPNLLPSPSPTPDPTPTSTLTPNLTPVVSVEPSPTPTPSDLPKPIGFFIFSPQLPSIREPIIFDASASIGQGSQIVSYQWDFADGTMSNENTPKITHTYNTTGNYSVSLTITNENGKKSTIQLPIIIGELRVNREIAYQFETITPNSIKVIATLTFELDNSPVEDAVVSINNLSAENLGAGRYQVYINSFMPTITIHTEVERKEIQFVNQTSALMIGNTLVFAISLGIPISILGFIGGKRGFRKYRQIVAERKKQKQEREEKERQRKSRAETAAREQARVRAEQEAQNRARQEEAARQQRERQQEQERYKQRQQTPVITKKDPYEVLQIPRNATKAEVKDAFRKLSMEWHPDKFAKHDDPKVMEMANEKYIEIKEAFETINRMKNWT